MRKLIVAFRNFLKAFKKGRKEVGETPEEESIGTCLEIFQVAFDSSRFGSLFRVLVTPSYSSNPTVSLTVPENQSPSTQFPI
jgi:hypothetical protein